MAQPHKSLKSVYEESETAYLEQREKLQSMCDQMVRLQKQRGATLVEASSAGDEWRQQFKAAMGKPSAKVRKLKEHEIGMRAEAEQLDELLEELEPGIAEARKATEKARSTLVNAHRRMIIDDASDALSAAMDEVLETDAGQALVSALGAKQAAAQQAVLSDASAMAAMGFDNASEVAQPTFMATITTADRKAIQDKASRHMASDVMAAFAPHLDSQHGAPPEPPRMLACEKA